MKTEFSLIVPFELRLGVSQSTKSFRDSRLSYCNLAGPWSSTQGPPYSARREGDIEGIMRVEGREGET